MNYISKTDKEIKQLALDIMAGKVFHSYYSGITEKELKIVFMPIIFLSDENIENIKKNDIVEFYEYMDKSSSLSVNGLPSFLSFNTLDRKDSLRLISALRKIKKHRKIHGV